MNKINLIIEEKTLHQGLMIFFSEGYIKKNKQKNISLLLLREKNDEDCTFERKLLN